MDGLGSLNDRVMVHVDRHRWRSVRLSFVLIFVLILATLLAGCGLGGWLAGTKPFTPDWSRLQTLTMASSENGWATFAQDESGDTSAIYRVTKGGGEFTDVTPDLEQPQGSLTTFLGADAWLVTPDGRQLTTLRTTNGGRAWTPAASVVMDLPPDYHLRLAYAEFTDSLHGWVVTAEGEAILGTVDGGATWRTLVRPPNLHPRGEPDPHRKHLIVTSDTTEWFTGSASQGEGQAWIAPPGVTHATQVQLPLSCAGGLTSTLAAIASGKDRAVVPVACPEGRPSVVKMAVIDESGAVESIGPALQVDSVPRICFAQPHFLVVADQTRLRSSEDDGQTWTTRPAPPEGRLTCAGGLLWVAGPKGISESTDGGATWKEIIVAQPR